MSEILKLVTRDLGEGAVLSADSILEANKGQFETVVIVGRSADGDIAVAGTHGAADSVMLLEWAKAYLVQNMVTR